MADRPKLNFMSYILMMYQSGLISLGKIENPITKKTHAEIEEAKSIIELIEVLEEKTKGNLTTEEDKTMKMVLDTLRNNLSEVIKNKDSILSRFTSKKDGESIEIH